MKTKTALYGLLLLFAALALSSCVGSRKTRCSCPNFRGSRAIYGKVDSKFNFVELASSVQISNSRCNTSEVEADNTYDLQLTTYDF